MSLPEVLLWQELRSRPDGLRFRRQFPIQGYVLDFACLERRLAIEIDGEAHSRGDRPRRDAGRDEVLSALGYATLRIPALDVLENLEAVLRQIIATCGERPLHHPRLRGGPSPLARGWSPSPFRGGFMKMNFRILALALTLAACENQPASNAAAPAPSTTAQETDCPVPGLNFTELKFAEAEKVAFTENWTAAADRACTEKLAGDRPLTHPDVLGPTLLLHLAPEANIISIYLNDRRTPGRMVMEGPFGTPPKAPSADDLHEAIYCAVKGAMPAEEEQSGRCLPD